MNTAAVSGALVGSPRRLDHSRMAIPEPAEDVFTFGDKSVDFNRLELRVGEQVFPLTLMEAGVLRYLIQNDAAGK